MSGRLPPLDIADQWPRLNEQLVSLVDAVPADKWNWHPQRGLWNFRGIFLHIPMARDNWLGNNVKDGEQPPDVLRQGQTNEGVKEQLRRSWQRLERFLSDPAKLAATYDAVYYGEAQRLTGHWIAYHLLEHDIHHRADIFHYLALLGIEHPHVETP